MAFTEKDYANAKAQHPKRIVKVIKYQFNEEEQEVLCILPDRNVVKMFLAMELKAIKETDEAKKSESNEEAMLTLLRACVVSPEVEHLIDLHFMALESVAAQLLRLVTGGEVEKKG